MNNRKPKILFVGESHHLNTGYARITKNLLERWHKTNKYEIAELAIYGDPQNSKTNCHWKVFFNLPNPGEEERFNSSTINQLGKFSFDNVCIEWMPDIVVDVRDIFMCGFEFDSPFRPFYYLFHQATVDAKPQADEWIAAFTEADGILTYSKWAGELLKEYSNINYLGWVPPCPDYNIYKPIQDLKNLRKFYGLEEDINILGFIGRNQKRKLIPDLLEAFEMFCGQAPQEIVNKTYLYLHTSYPDMGWELPTLLKEYGLTNKVLFSYKCKKCQTHMPSFFQDGLAVCKKCGSPSLIIPGVEFGLEEDELNQIYNLFDCYVHLSCASGFEVPCVESAAAGIPGFVLNYSALEDFPETIKAYPIKVLNYYREVETNRLFALPDKQDLVDKLITYLSLPKLPRNKRKFEVASSCRKNYNWDTTANKWMEIFDQLPLKDIRYTWFSPPRIHEPKKQIPNNLKNDEFVNWAIANVLGLPELCNSYFAMKLTRYLNLGVNLTGGVTTIFADMSVVSQNRPRNFDRNILLQELYNRRMEYNQLEITRIQYIQRMQNADKV